MLLNSLPFIAHVMNMLLSMIVVFADLLI